MKFDVTNIVAVIEELNKIKNSIENIDGTIDQIIASISKNWKSDASDQLVKNMKSSMNTFASYSDQLNKIIIYMQETVSEITATEQSNEEIADSLTTT